MEQFIEEPQALPEFPGSSYANLYLYTIITFQNAEYFFVQIKTQWDKIGRRIP